MRTTLKKTSSTSYLLTYLLNAKFQPEEYLLVKVYCIGPSHIVYSLERWQKLVLLSALHAYIVGVIRQLLNAF